MEGTTGTPGTDKGCRLDEELVYVAHSVTVSNIALRFSQFRNEHRFEEGRFVGKEEQDKETDWSLFIDP